MDDAQSGDQLKVYTTGSPSRNQCSKVWYHPDPLVQIRPESAAFLGIADGGWVYLESPFGRARLKARLFDGIAPDVVNAEHA